MQAGVIGAENFEMIDVQTYRSHPSDKVAIIMAESEREVTFGELEYRANQGAHLFRKFGVQQGDVVALCLSNGPSFFFVAIAARRCGATVLPLSTKLTTSEVEFILRDGAAKLLVIDEQIEAESVALEKRFSGIVMTIGFRSGDLPCWDGEIDSCTGEPISDEARGAEMLYSSGTTGRPKGIMYKHDGGLLEGGVAILPTLGFTDQTVYLNPAPLYHSAPYGWSLGTIALGGTVVVMERFDAELALRAIEKYRVNCSQWVPTHFVRLLKLPEEIRAKYDLSSLRLAVHASAPCPPTVKRAMIAWWGPILLEYFGSTEQMILTIITSEEALRHPGSVGRCVEGIRVHICDENQRPLPTGAIGHIYAEGATEFAYRNDEAKTHASRSEEGWTTVGDMGHLDNQGYLYLSDRKDFMINTGGVNVYPQEIEDVLVTHPDVTDAAVLGVPNEDLGEVVVAAVQLAVQSKGSAAFEGELRAWMRRSLSGVKVPRHIVFCAELPRLPTGKMAKRLLREDITAALAKAEAR